MPRKKRYFRQNCFHHVMFRGVNGENIFWDNRDKTKFCLLLQEACEKHGVTIHGFCLMTNHIHLILMPEIESFQSGIHCFAFRYAQYFNRRHKRHGYLFQNRFKSIIVEDGMYLKRLIRYIHLNPLEAGLVTKPQDYIWSSYRAYLEQDFYTWLDTDSILKRFGVSREAAIQELIEFTHQKRESSSDLALISKAFRKGVFGGEEFCTANANAMYEENSLSKNIKCDVTLENLLTNVCQKFEVSLEDLQSSSKEKKVVRARSMLAIITRKARKWPLEDLARLLNKNNGTISRLASQAEKQLDLGLICINDWLS